MNIAEWALKHKIVTLALTLAMLAGGILSYQKLGRLEDPEFTIKVALVMTPYPGASAVEVEEEVTEKIEKAVQQMGQLDHVESRSERDISTVTVTIKDTVPKKDLPQTWDELRRKIHDMQSTLPPGAGPSRVVDDYGDVYGVFFAVTGPEYSYAELKKLVKMLQRELLRVQDVAKVELSGLRTEAVYIIPDKDRMAKLGLPYSVIGNAITAQNAVSDSGRVKVGPEWITLETTGTYTSVNQFENLMIPVSGSETAVYLKDIARIKRGYVEPQSDLMRYDGKVAIGLGISTVSGGNAVTMGEAVKKRLDELASRIPLGIDISPVSMQSDSVRTAISNFMTSLIQAVIIVIVVLMVFMGFRSAALIGFILCLTVAGTFILMKPYHVALERISLGALIIALGMLVDNAIVIVDGILIRVKQGMNKTEAAIQTVKQTAWPLFGATLIAILAFAAIGTSQDSTGEFCRSLFQVILFSLGLSWVTAVTVTPLLAVMILPVPEDGNETPFTGRFYTLYRKLLKISIRFRWVTIGLVVFLFLVALWGFGFVQTSFFPDSTRPQFLVNVTFSQGTHIDTTSDRSKTIESYIASLDAVTHVTTLVGKGALRFLLTYAPEMANTAYVQFIVDVDDYLQIDGLLPVIEDYMMQHFPDGLTRCEKMALGPGGSKIALRLSGPDRNTLRLLAEKAEDIMHSTGMAQGIRTNWRQRVKTIQVDLAEEQANANGITRPDVSQTIRESFEGCTIGVYRESDELLPVILRADEQDLSDIGSLKNLQIWSPKAGRRIPLRQVIHRITTGFEDEIIQRRDRIRTITISADPNEGILTSRLQKELMGPIAGIEYPKGYHAEWGGEYEDSAKASGNLMGGMPMIALLMALTLIALFNSIREPLVILLCVPLALIGVSAGLLATRQPFGFMSILGFLSLSGMLIKNAIVLIDQIRIELDEGKKPIHAVIDSGISRVLPVSMAALTTALGMIPLLFDAFFVAMSVTIIAGLMFATLLTMVFVPVLYTIFFSVENEVR